MIRSAGIYTRKDRQLAMRLAKNQVHTFRRAWKCSMLFKRPLATSSSTLSACNGCNSSDKVLTCVSSFDTFVCHLNSIYIYNKVLSVQLHVVRLCGHDGSVQKNTKTHKIYLCTIITSAQPSISRNSTHIQHRRTNMHAYTSMDACTQACTHTHAPGYHALTLFTSRYLNM